MGEIERILRHNLDMAENEDREIINTAKLPTNERIK